MDLFDLPRTMVSRLCGLFGFKPRLAPKVVLLFKFNGNVKRVRAMSSQSGGWIARWHDMSDGDILLLPGGKVANASLVVEWRPHSGWSEEELLLAYPPPAPTPHFATVVAAPPPVKKIAPVPPAENNTSPTFGL